MTPSIKTKFLSSLFKEHVVPKFDPIWTNWYSDAFESTFCLFNKVDIIGLYRRSLCGIAWVLLFDFIRCDSLQFHIENLRPITLWILVYIMRECFHSKDMYLTENSIGLYTFAGFEERSPESWKKERTQLSTWSCK